MASGLRPEWERLNHEQDQRPGVGLHADGLPDLVWYVAAENSCMEMTSRNWNALVKKAAKATVGDFGFSPFQPLVCTLCMMSHS